MVFIIGLGILQFVGIFWYMSRGGMETYMPYEVKTRFADVWGQDHVLERVKENMIFPRRPRGLEKKGGHVPGGILLWGPPGTGKTLMAEAVAGETGKPYVFVDPGAFQAMFMGVGIMKVKALFKKLRKLALRYGGVIVFFDEADVLGNRGGSVSNNMQPAGEDLTFGPNACGGVRYLSSHSQSFLFEQHMRPAQATEAPRSTRIHKLVMGGMGGGGGLGELQALLTELSGLKKPRGIFWRRIRSFLCMPQRAVPHYRILVMMATNMPSSLDPALLRPGRLDRIYKVGYPSKAGRKKTYEGYFGRIKHSVTAPQMERLATMTPYATGASIKDLVNESLIVALRNGRDFVTWPDVVTARKIKMVGPGENVDYIERERHAIALHEACHAVMAFRVQKGHDIDLATIEKGSDFLGFVSPIPMEEMFTDWRSTYESDILVSLASLAGERIFFDNDNSSGVTGDCRTQHRWRLRWKPSGAWARPSARTSPPRPRGEARRFSSRTAPIATCSRPSSAGRVERGLQRLLQQATRLLQENSFEVLAGRARARGLQDDHRRRHRRDHQRLSRARSSTAGRITRRSSSKSPRAYHQRVISAHREQGRVDMALPVFAGDVAQHAAYNYRNDDPPTNYRNEDTPPPPA
jgi:DNA polymerase III delta prime subunit